MEVSDHSFIVSMGMIAFVAPYILLASPAGWLADRFQKRHVIIGCKVAEIVVMGLGMIAVLVDNIYFLLGTVFLMGAQSALFAPAKVGTIPELLDEEKISAGNGVFNLATLTATVIGTAIGALLADVTMGGTESLWLAATTVIGVAVVGTALSFMIHTLPAANKTARFPKFILDETARDIYQLPEWGRLARVALGVIFFWTVAGMANINIDAFGDEGGALFESERTPLLISLTLGVGLGSVFAGVASAGRIELGLVPWGAAGIAAFCLFLGFAPDYFLIQSDSSLGLIIACTLLAGLGISAGLFDVPLASYLQNKSPIERRGAILSATNCLAFGGILVAALIYQYGCRVPTAPGTQAQLPDQYRPTEESQVAMEGPVFQALLAEVSQSDEVDDLESLKLPSSLDANVRRGWLTELVWQDFTRLLNCDNQKIAVKKYQKLFPDEQDQRQSKFIIRTASPQPRFSARHIFFFVGLMTIPVVAYASWRLPQKMVRIAFWWLFNILYRVRVRGLENIPEKGGAILVFNHCSWLDGATILSLNPRMMRTIAWSGNFENYFLKKWADFCGVILMSAGPKSIRRGLKEAQQALADGQLVAIFAEGGITQSGQIRSFKPGVMKIIENSSAPVIPCFIDEMWAAFSVTNAARPSIGCQIPFVDRCRCISANRLQMCNRNLKSGKQCKDLVPNRFRIVSVRSSPRPVN